MEVEKPLVVGRQLGSECDVLKRCVEAERARLREERLCQREFAKETAEQSSMQQERAKELVEIVCLKLRPEREVLKASDRNAKPSGTVS